MHAIIAVGTFCILLGTFRVLGFLPKMKHLQNHFIMTVYCKRYGFTFCRVFTILCGKIQEVPTMIQIAPVIHYYCYVLSKKATLFRKHEMQCIT